MRSFKDISAEDGSVLDDEALDGLDEIDLSDVLKEWDGLRERSKQGTKARRQDGKRVR